MAAAISQPPLVQRATLRVEGKNNLMIVVGDSLKGFHSSVIHSFEAGIETTMYEEKFTFLQVQKRVHQFIVRFFDEKGGQLYEEEVLFRGNDQVYLIFSLQDAYALTLSIPVKALSSKPSKLSLIRINEKRIISVDQVK